MTEWTRTWKCCVLRECMDYLIFRKRSWKRTTREHNKSDLVTEKKMVRWEWKKGKKLELGLLLCHLYSFLRLLWAPMMILHSSHSSTSWNKLPTLSPPRSVTSNRESQKN